MNNRMKENLESMQTNGNELSNGPETSRALLPSLPNLDNHMALLK